MTNQIGKLMGKLNVWLETSIFCRSLGILVLATLISSCTHHIEYSSGYKIKASRLFSGPNTFPPKSFAAYGIVAFPSLASEYDKKRHELICNAYVAYFPNSLDIITFIPKSEQMVTVWPLNTDDLINEVNVADFSPEICKVAVGNYGLLQSKIAISEAKSAGKDISGRGPWLLAWSPTEKKGDSNAIVLVIDMSSVDSYASAVNIFDIWSTEIEGDPELWRAGFNLDLVRDKLRSWVDRNGEAILGIFK